MKCNGEPVGAPRVDANMLQAMTSWVVIIRAIHCRGTDQDDALIELDRRRLWLTETQKIEAGLASARVH